MAPELAFEAPVVTDSPRGLLVCPPFWRGLDGLPQLRELLAFEVVEAELPHGRDRGL